MVGVEEVRHHGGFGAAVSRLTRTGPLSPAPPTSTSPHPPDRP
ncbi:MAG: hypothetical protein AVDCRST_MAG48-1417 [uncultured Friedmanniella sp.]|uniref:Uncharacterized protein n=1 Tax=uncultured Friedmanniella sp. TaxID=335381 RepID=A0A6J4KCX8_9ACTN|nr:MAG: hypothetical protein AVDCRST_MAG48-1417 [uncultured Friedmanniella sp.]